MDWGGLDPQWWWLIGAALLAIAEIAISGVFLVWVAAAAAITGILVMLTGLSLPFQLALFALLSIAAVYSGRQYYERNPVPTSDPKLNDRTARLIGQTVTVVAAIEGGEGRVKVGDSVWSARGDDAAVGTRVRIASAEGTCLRVEPLEARQLIKGPGPVD
jgi:inner membrane protein